MPSLVFPKTCLKSAMKVVTWRLALGPLNLCLRLKEFGNPSRHDGRFEEMYQTFIISPNDKPDTNIAMAPVVTVLSADGSASGSTLPLPKVFHVPIRPDIVSFSGNGGHSQPLTRAIQGPIRSHWNGQEQASTICRFREGWSPNFRRVMGYRSVIIILRGEIENHQRSGRSWIVENGFARHGSYG